MKRKPTAQQATAEVVQLAGQVWEILKKFDHLRESYRPRPVLETALLSGFTQLRGVASTIVELESRIDPTCLPVVVLARCLLELVPTSPDVSFLGRISEGALRDQLRRADSAIGQWKNGPRSGTGGDPILSHQDLSLNQELVLRLLAAAEQPHGIKELQNAATIAGMRGRRGQKMSAKSFAGRVLKPLQDSELVAHAKKQGSGVVITSAGRIMLCMLSENPTVGST